MRCCIQSEIASPNIRTYVCRPTHVVTSVRRLCAFLCSGQCCTVWEAEMKVTC